VATKITGSRWEKLGFSVK